MVSKRQRLHEREARNERAFKVCMKFGHKIDPQWERCPAANPYNPKEACRAKDFLVNAWVPETLYNAWQEAQRKRREEIENALKEQERLQSKQSNEQEGEKAPEAPVLGDNVANKVEAAQPPVQEGGA